MLFSYLFSFGGGMAIEKKRLWRIRIWLQLPKRLVPSEPPKKSGFLPEQLKAVDIYPEMRLLESKDFTVGFKRSEPLGNIETNYMLECFVKGDEPMSAWESIGGKTELILDILSFTLQIPIRTVYFEALDLTPPLVLKSEREFLIGNEVPRVQKDTASQQMNEKWAIGINPRLMALELDEMVEAALRWYSKGVATVAIVDKFVFFWIALESLSMPVKPRRRVFFRCQKCDYEIQKCPKCSYSTEHFPDVKERLKEFLISKLRRPSDLFDRLWKARMMFHGRNMLTSDEVKNMMDMAYELNLIIVEALKLRLGLRENEPPALITRASITMAGQPFLGGMMKITKRDIKSFLRSKSSYQNLLIKN
jgi:hypothetical protein